MKFLHFDAQKTKKDSQAMRKQLCPNKHKAAFMKTSRTQSCKEKCRNVKTKNPEME